MKIIGIAGGSGAGKSTVSYALQDAYPDLIEVVNLDDYQKLRTDDDLPMVDDMINWDHPDIIRWDKLLSDLIDLKAGKSVTINSWAHRSNPDYQTTGKMVPRTVQPKPIIIIEGYLALYNPKILALYDQSYYLDLDDETRNSRRGKNEIIADNKYEDKVLIPMHKKFVEPTNQNADHIIDVSNKTVEEIAKQIYKNF